MEYSKFWEHCVPAAMLAKLPHCSQGDLEPEALCDVILHYGCPICREFMILIVVFGFSGREAVNLLKVKAKLG